MSSKKQYNRRKTLSVMWQALPVFMITTSIAAAPNEYETPEYFAQRGLSLINAIDAYNQGYTGQGVTVGVVDSGIVVNHPEFAGKIAGGYDFNLVQAITQESGTDEIPMGHGSHVSGIIAANRDGEGMHGVAFNSKLFVARYGLGGLDDDDDDDDDDDGDGDYEQFAAITDHIFSNAWNYMAEQRLAVINNSLGVNNCSGGAASDGSKPCNVADFLPEATHYFDAKTLFPNIIDAFHNLQKAGTLMVFATGNEVQPNPDFFAGMPLLYPELQPNWLAITAVNADLESSTPNLAWYSNACGLAKAWCLAAPGSNADGYVGINSVHSAGGYVKMEGTSMAAPHATGVAALVKEAFPFFTAYHLQQSLLTTATDLTPSDGYRLDDRFGWGLLNAGKAVRGPAAFVSMFDVDTQGYNATFSNDISDLSTDPDFLGQKGSLRKTGAGSLTLSGSNTYQGTTTVDGGTLRITGTQNTGDHIVNAGVLRVDGTIAPGVMTTVNTQGALEGVGTTGSVLNKGTVAPGNSIGTLTVNGNYTAAPGSTLAIEVDNNNRVDVLRVTGNTSFQSGAVVALQGEVFRQGINYNFLEAGGTVANQGLVFDSSLLFLTPRATASASGLSFNVQRNSVAFSNFTSGHNQTAVANALDRLSNQPATGLSTIYDELLNGQGTGFGAKMDQLSGEAYASVESALFTQSKLWTNAASRRMDTLFSGFHESQSPMWLSVQGQWTDLNGRSGTADVRNTTHGLFIGGDARIGTGGHVGAAFGYHDGKVQVHDRQSHAKTQSYTLAVYGGTQWALSNGHMLNWHSSAAWTHHDVDMKRNGITVGKPQSLSTSYHSQQVQAYTELGYAMPVSTSTALQPFARLDWTQQRSGSFTESGGEAALHGKRQTNDVTSFNLGLRSYWACELSHESAARISASIGWRHAQGDVTPTRTLQFDQLREARFTVNGAPISRNSLQLGLNGEVDVHKNASIGLNYRGEFGGGNTSNAGSLYLNVRF